jgi:hypothetical protein
VAAEILGEVDVRWGKDPRVQLAAEDLRQRLEAAACLMLVTGVEPEFELRPGRAIPCKQARQLLSDVARDRDVPPAEIIRAARLSEDLGLLTG